MPRAPKLTRRTAPFILAVVLISAAVKFFAPSQPGKGSAQPLPPPARPAPTAEAPLPESSVGVRIKVRRVIDGDTLEIARDDGRIERLRVFGVNTPELHPRPGVPHDTFTPQAFAQDARDRTAQLCPEGGDSRMVERGRDKYSRLLAHLYTRDGRDVARTLIEEGLGRAYFVEESKKDPLRPIYESVQNGAKSAKRGVWSK